MLVAFAAGYHYFQKSPHESSPATRTEQTPSPVAVPGSAAVEGPYFSDGGRVAERIVAAINRSQKLIHVAVYDLTHPEIAAALVAAHRRGVEVRIATDEGQSGGPHSEIAYLRSQGIAVRLSGGYRGNRSIMHNKFAVFSGSWRKPAATTGRSARTGSITRTPFSSRTLPWWRATKRNSSASGRRPSETACAPLRRAAG